MGRNTVEISGFPSYATYHGVKEFLEKYVGEDSITALKLRPSRGTNTRRETCARVQFSTSEIAEDISSMIQQGTLLFYRGSHLKVCKMERDIEPMASILHLENAVLQFGCLVAQDKFSILWSGRNTRVTFEFNRRKIYFFLSHKNHTYMLELSYESIWEIQWRRTFAQRDEFLLFQVLAAPKIYVMQREKVVMSSADLIDKNYLDILSKDWVRTTDFTPSFSIGQSSALCLKLPYGHCLPNLSEYIPHYSEVKSCLMIENGYSYSQNIDLVPIVEPSRGEGIEVPYRILFQINSLVQHGSLIGPMLDRNFYSLVSSCNAPLEYIKMALSMMSVLESSCFSPANWLQEQYKNFQKQNYPANLPFNSLNASLVYIHRVEVTPSKVYFYGPEVNESNRVLRHYSQFTDNFLRVSFVDENGEKLHSTDISSRSPNAVDKRTALYRRILSTLQKGIAVADKKFEFLAFSSSQLRENSVWMFASVNGLTAAHIRDWLGDFREIRNVAKYAARLGQSFSSSTETLTVERNEVDLIPDVEYAGYIFSDGIGKISVNFAKKVAKKCRIKGSTPSAFQIRYGGYKGVVSVDPTSKKKLSLRKSMLKFESENRKLDVLSYSKSRHCFLNRQLITLLSTLGIDDHVFERKLEEAISQVDEILDNPDNAWEAISCMPPGETTNILKKMISCGYEPGTEPFLTMTLQAFRASRMRELRSKARIHVPEGRSLMGCLDETKSLEYGQVFVQVSSSRNLNISNNGLSMFQTSGSHRHSVVVIGKVVVAKNPCLHPGDIRILTAVDIPKLHHMIDCIVFPQKGKRPHPNECSGSDLDGDMYFVSWDPELIPPHVVEPMDYTPAPTKDMDHYVEIEEVMEYFADYIVNDSLGIIANAHTVFADRETNKALSTPCIQLAKLFSIAVDFPKTGVPAIIPRDLRVEEYPDFMEKLDGPTYQSRGVIGKLYKATRDHVLHSSRIKAFTKEVAKCSYDPDMEVNGFRDYLDEALYYKEIYDSKLGNIMKYYGIKTEAEILSGNILKMSKSFNRHKDGEVIAKAVKLLRKEAREWFTQNNNNGNYRDENQYAKASAWYHATYNLEHWARTNEGRSPHFLSFPWCVIDKLVAVKKSKTRGPRQGGRNRRMDSIYKQDLFNDSKAVDELPGTETAGTKLIISNLDYGVSNDNIREIFSACGGLKHCTLHYNRDGCPSGSAEVIFLSKSSALEAQMRYNSVHLDGRPMKIESIGSSSGLHASTRINVVVAANGRGKRSAIMN